MNINNTSITLGALSAQAAKSLECIYDHREARAMVRIIFEELGGYTTTDLIVRADVEATPYLVRKVDETVRRLLDGEPLQYILGSARFYGLNLRVTPATLIPRPETAELVDMIVRYADNRADLHVLDICTGSGCIAIALARHLRFPIVEATDISADAIGVGVANSRNLKSTIEFRCEDILSTPPPLYPRFDIIVSNPPYIADFEKKDMADNVLLHEPATALFVPDDDPLLFYRTIARYAKAALKPGGTLWFEINPLFASELSQMLADNGYTDICITRDMQGKQRFARATSPAR